MNSVCLSVCLSIEDILQRGLDILIGTPGRVLDHVERGTLDLSQVK